MKKIVLGLLAFLIGLPIFAQRTETFSVDIPWQSNEVATFNGLSYLFPKLAEGMVDGSKGLPFFITSKIINSDEAILSVNIVPLEVYPVEISSKVGFVKYDTIGHFRFDWNSTCDRKQNGVALTMKPLFLDSLGVVVFAKRAEITIHYQNKVVTLLKSATASFTNKSVLAEGNWVKVRIDKTGMHQIDYATLASWGFHDPSKVKIYGNGGNMLPRANNVYREDDLAENAVYDNSNALLFYAKSVVNWKYSALKNMYLQELNDYDLSSYYFITENDKPRKTFGESAAVIPDVIATTYVAYDFHEQNSVNLIQTGRIWLGEQLSASGIKSEKSFVFNTPNINVDGAGHLMINAQVVARSDQGSTFGLYVNDGLAPDTSIVCYQVPIGSITEKFADDESVFFKSSSYEDITTLRVKFNPLTNVSVGWINSLTINALSNLVFHSGELMFRNPYVVDPFNSTEFRMTGTLGKSLMVLDVTNPVSPIKMNSHSLQDTLVFGVRTQSLQEFVAFEPTASFATPTFMGGVANQNLHGHSQVDYVIVAPTELVNQANALAQIHTTYNGISPTVIDVNQIYNEYSGGKQDPMAIRAFMRMLYARAGSDQAAMPKYLLLYGDGSYDNLGVIPKNKSKIVTNQSLQSFHQTDSYVTDDLFGFLDDNEGNNDTSDLLDIGIGRFVVNNQEEASIANNKVLAYLTSQDRTDWQSRVTFVAQDGDNNLHQNDAEKLSVYLRTYYPQFESNKIYSDAYRKVSTAQSGAYPDGDLAVQNALINNGSLILNYTGHGAVNQIAYNYLNIQKVDQLNNIHRLTFFVTATCDVSRYDNPDEKSLGEHVFLNPRGGGIGLISTTRIVYANYNYNINYNFYKNVFSKNANNEPLRLGDIVRKSKNGSLPVINKLNFTLIGDPGLRLNYPKNNVQATEIKNIRLEPVSLAVSDTLHGLTKGRISGEIQNPNSTLLGGFNGAAMITLYDKISKVKTLGNSGQTPYEYEVYQNILYRGKAEVKDGKFSTEFMVPKDIHYEYGFGKVALYATSNDSVTAFGLLKDVVIGELDPQAESNDQGPQLDLYMNALSFKDGGTTSLRPEFIALVVDSNGINTAGSGIGHDLLFTIDDDPFHSYVLNSYFEFDPNKYTSGSVRFQLPSMSVGKHTATFRIWDCNNNSTTKTISFMVVDNGDLEIMEPLLYPNPLSPDQTLKIRFNHDEPNTTLEIRMEIYTIDGSLVDKFNYTEIDQNGITPNIEWVPRNGGGAPLNTGVYICKLWLNSSNGKSSTFSKRFVVLR